MKGHFVCEKSDNITNSLLLKSSLSEFFPVSEKEARDLDELAETFTDRSELRAVLEDYFHIYDDYAALTVNEFDGYLADYFDSL